MKVRFSKILVIQSLKSGEMKTGSLLHEDIETLENYHERGLKTILHNVGCKAELTDLLSVIEKKVQTEGEVPVLHFEMHGSVNGLELASSEFIHWDQLKEHLIRINVLTKNNLLITLAACYGAHLTSVLQITDRAPCWALIGPKETIWPENLQKSWLEFYRETFKTLNGNRALKRLNDAIDPTKLTYSFTQCEFFFKLMYSHYLKKHFAPRGIKVRAEDFYRKLKAANKDVKHPKDVKKTLLQTREMYFEKHRKNFFMMDLYPENHERFKVTYLDVQDFSPPWDSSTKG